MKYKACCGRRCCVGGCEIRENGGCYCACKFRDYITTLKSNIEGHSLHGGCIWYPTIEARNEHLSKMSEEEQLKEENFRLVEAPKLLEEAIKMFDEKYIVKNDS